MVEIQQAVKELISLGTLPSSSNPNVELLEKMQKHIASVKQPISDDEAKALINIFGPDECFGLAWSILHLIESAPSWPIWDCLEDSENEWIRRLRERAIRK